MNSDAVEKEKSQELTLPQELFLLAEVIDNEIPGKAYTLVEDLVNYQGHFNGIMWPVEIDIVRENLQNSNIEEIEKELPVRISAGLSLVNELSQTGEKIGEHKRLVIVCGPVGAWNYILEMPINGEDNIPTITYHNRKQVLDKNGKKESSKEKEKRRESEERMFRRLAHSMRYRLENFIIMRDQLSN